MGETTTDMSDYFNPQPKPEPAAKKAKKPLKRSGVKKKKELDADLWYWFSIYIRLRDSDENGYAKCCTCGVVRKWNNNMQCGHGIPRQHWGTKYDERNNHAQCKKCNGPEGGNQVKYKEFIDKKYGPNTWDMLEFNKQNYASKPSEAYIKISQKHYCLEAMKLAKQKGLEI